MGKVARLSERDRYRVPSRVGRTTRDAVNFVSPPPLPKRERNALDTISTLTPSLLFIFVRTPVSFQIIDRSADRVRASMEIVLTSKRHARQFLDELTRSSGEFCPSEDLDFVLKFSF